MLTQYLEASPEVLLRIPILVARGHLLIILLILVPLLLLPVRLLLLPLLLLQLRFGLQALLDLLLLLVPLHVLIILLLQVRVQLLLRLQNFLEYISLFLDVELDNEGVVFEGDGAHLHVICLEQVRRPGVDNGDTLLLAALDRVLFGQLRALLNGFGRQLVIGGVREVHAQVDVRGGQAINMEPKDGLAPEMTERKTN